jgi:ATP synthase protein I
VSSTRPSPPQPDGGKNEYRQYLSHAALGIEIGVALAIGMLIGWYLDRLFGTRPWLVIIFSLFGIAAGFRNIIQLARKDWDEDNHRENNSS